MQYFNTCMRDCFGSCSIISEVRGGDVLRARGNPDHPITRGFLCRKMRDIPGQQRHPERLLHPLIRTGPKGSGGFRRAGWPEAMQLVADRLGQLAADDPASILQFNCGGNMGVLNSSIPERFFNRLGATGVVETICNAAGQRALQYVYGSCHGQDPEVIPGLELLVVWGGNPAWSNVHGAALIGELRRRGGQLWIIDPLRTATARMGRHLAPRPGSDFQLALGLVHLLQAEGRLDMSTLPGQLVGLEQLLAAAERYTPSRVEAETGICAAELRALAAALHRHRESCLIQIGWGLQRHLGGGEAVRAIAFLPAVLGLGRRGFIYSNNSYGFDRDWLEARELDRGRPRVNMMQVGELLAAGRFGALICYSANPMASQANLGLLERGLLRDDLFTVVHDLFMTDTAARADVVFPATHFLESADLRPSYYHRYLGLNSRAVPPAGDAASNRQLFRRLARAMDLGKQRLQQPDDQLLAGALGGNRRLEPGAWEALLERGYVRMRLPALQPETPSGRIEIVSETAGGEGAGSFPCWQAEATPAPGQLRLLSPVHRDVLRSQDHWHPLHRHPSVSLNPADAASRDIAEGQRVLVSSQQGAASMVALLTPGVPAGTALSYSSPWPRLAGGTTVNHLTPDRVQPHAGGSTYNSALVTVEPITGAAGRCPAADGGDAVPDRPAETPTG